MVLFPESRRALEQAAGDVPVVHRGLRHRRRPRRGAGGWRPRSRARTSPRSRDLDADGVPCRLYRPGDARAGVVVHLHGGGFVFHDIDVHDASARRLANRCGLAVLSVDYRRPPEHRFPAAPDDVSTVVGWLDARGRRAWARPARRTSTATAPAATSRWSRRCATRAGSRAVALIYPFLDPTARLRLLPHRGRRLRPARGRLVLAAVRRHAGRPDRPRPRAAAAPTGSAPCPRRWW